MTLFGRRRWDAPPTTPASVLMASPGPIFSDAAIERAASLADGGPVAVLVIARLHGYAFGMPNPGLLPTRKEKEAAQANVERAIRYLEGRGLKADGQIAITRGLAKLIARTAVTRRARVVVLDRQPGSQIRRLVEGDLAKNVGRRLRGRDSRVEVV